MRPYKGPKAGQCRSFGPRSGGAARAHTPSPLPFAALRHRGPPGPAATLRRLMTWEPELEELRRREELARSMGGEERVARQHASGRLTVRERIERLVDTGSFHETGAL